MLPNLSPKIADRILSFQAMTPISDDTRNSDSRPIGNPGCLTCLASRPLFVYNDLRTDMSLKENKMKAFQRVSLMLFVPVDNQEG
jgi:hypothetical protein